MNFNDVLNPAKAVEVEQTVDIDTTEAAVAAYEAMNDVEIAMIKVDMLEKAGKVLSDSLTVNDALVAKGYESESGVSPVTTGYEAVCVMLGYEGEETEAGYEADDNKKAEGLLSKIWAGIKKAAKALWASITSFFGKIKDFILSLIGKGKDTAKKLDEIALAKKLYERTLTTDEVEKTASKLKYILVRNPLGYSTISEYLKSQVNIMTNVLNDDLVKGVTGFENEIKGLMKATDDNLSKTALSMESKITNMLNALVYDSLFDELDKETQTLLNTKSEKVNTPIDGYKNKSNGMIISNMDKNGITILIFALFSKEGKFKLVTDKFTVTLKDVALDNIIKRDKNAKTLTKKEITNLAKEYGVAGGIAKDVITKVNIKSMSKSVESILDISERILKERLSDVSNKKISKETYDSIKETLSVSKEIVNKILPIIVSGVTKTANDIISSPVVDYAALSLKDGGTKEDQKEDKKEDKEEDKKED